MAKKQKTEIYYERSGSDRAKAQVEAEAFAIYHEESLRYYWNQEAAKILIQDLRAARGNPKGLIAAL